LALVAFNNFSASALACLASALAFVLAGPFNISSASAILF